MTRSGGRRFYRPQDLDVLRGVRALLHDEGRSIKDVQRLHREEGLARVIRAGAGHTAAREPPNIAPAEAMASGPRPALAEGARRTLDEVLADLERVKVDIDRLLAAAPQS